MKKVIFSIVGSMLIGLCTVQAQQDESASKSRNKQQAKDRTEQTTNDSQTNDSHWNRDQSWQQQSDRNRYASEGMVEIEKEQIPSSLKETLQDEKYSGWENATIYHNTNSGEYVIAPKAYRFDDKGKEIEMGEDNAYGSQRSSRYPTGDGSTGDQMNQQSQDSRQMDQSSSSQDQTGNDQATGQSQRYDQSGNTQQSSSGYRSGQDAAGERTDGSQNNGTSATDATSSGNSSTQDQ